MRTKAITSSLLAVALSALFVVLVLQLPSSQASADASPLELMALREGPHDGRHTLLLKNPSTTDYTTCQAVLDDASQFVPVGSMPAGEVISVEVESWVDVSRLKLRCAEGEAFQRWVPRVPQH